MRKIYPGIPERSIKIQHFLREALVSCCLEHEHVLTLRGIAYSGGDLSSISLVTTYMPDQDLRHMLSIDTSGVISVGVRERWVRHMMASCTLTHGVDIHSFMKRLWAWSTSMPMVWYTVISKRLVDFIITCGVKCNT